MQNKLSDKKLKFVDTYLNSKSITDTCKKLDIARATAYEYLNDEDVKAEIRLKRQEIIEDTTLYLQSNLRECSIELMNIIKSETTPAQTKINAINSVFTNFNKLTEINDVLTRLADIEQILADKDNFINET